jgi:LPS sulfotransferase NodH
LLENIQLTMQQNIDPKNVAQAREAVHASFGRLPIPERCYCVLMSPRSGSTLLCTHLQNIKYGYPIEAFHFSHNRLRRLYGWEIDFADPFAHMKKALDFQTVNGIFGTKFSWIEFELFLQAARKLTASSGLQLNDAELMDVFFPNAVYVHLKRRYKVKQAISYAKAMQNGIWHVQAEQTNDNKAYAVPEEYNREHIEACLDNLLAFDVAWQNYLQRHNLPFMELWYEDLAKDYQGKMLEIYRYLGIEQGELAEPPLKKLANTESQEWIKRFTAETPWLENETIRKALETGDVSTAFVYRMMLLTREKERRGWANIPVNRFRLKRIKLMVSRVKRKLGLG